MRRRANFEDLHDSVSRLKDTIIKMAWLWYKESLGRRYWKKNCSRRRFRETFIGEGKNSSFGLIKRNLWGEQKNLM